MYDDEELRIGLEHLVKRGYIKIAYKVGEGNSVHSQRRIYAKYDILNSLVKQQLNK